MRLSPPTRLGGFPSAPGRSAVPSSVASVRPPAHHPCQRHLRRFSRRPLRSVNARKGDWPWEPPILGLYCSAEQGASGRRSLIQQRLGSVTPVAPPTPLRSRE